MRYTNIVVIRELWVRPCPVSSQYTLTMLGLLLLLTCHLAWARARLLPPGTCEVEGQACDIGQDNLLSALPGVESLQQCEAICIDNFDCEFITYFGSDSFPLRNYCMLFNDCTALADCQDCTTAVELCFEQCGQTVEGPLHNVLFVQYLLLAPEQVGSYFKSSILLYHLTYG